MRPDRPATPASHDGVPDSTPLLRGAATHFAEEYAQAVGADGWQRAALHSVFSTARAIQPSGRGYVNGQHRAQAMLDAGVRHTVVLRHVWPAAH